MDDLRRYLVFALDEQSYALDLAVVERVVRMVEITPLPTAPKRVLGAVNVQGTVIPVYSLRDYFALPERAIRLSDQLVIAHTPERNVALAIDATAGVIACPEGALVAAGEILPRLEGVEGVIIGVDGMIVISDLGRLLCLDEEFDAAVAALAVAEGELG